MVDPFQREARRQRITQVGAFALLIGFLGALFFVWVRGDVGNGREVQAVIVSLATSADPLGTGDSPVLTVQLPAGSVRVVRALSASVNGCAAGSPVSLVQRGTGLQVGVRGCHVGG